ncbi:MAG: hypothetical protein P1V97_09855 [Planctomycetota bacterium]|nr:hypothetical protein [Planctomycetota bacterium]
MTPETPNNLEPVNRQGLSSLYKALYDLSDAAILALDTQLQEENMSPQQIRDDVGKLLSSIQDLTTSLEIIDNPWAYTDTVIEDAPTKASSQLAQDFQATHIINQPPRTQDNDTILDSTPLDSDTILDSPASEKKQPKLPRLDDKFNNALMELSLDVEQALQEAQGQHKVPKILARTLLKTLSELSPELVAERIQTAIEDQEPFSNVELMNMGGMGWVFSATSTQDNQRRALKVPQKFVAKEIAELYEREMMFMATILENELNEEGWFVHFEEEGHIRVGSQEYSYAILKYYPGPERAINIGSLEITSDQALSLKELIPVFNNLSSIMSALITESALLALIEIQEMGFIHGDLKPSNYLVRARIAEILWPMIGKPGPWSNELQGRIYKILMESKVRVITADFGAIREMESFLLGDEVLDEKTGEELVVQTPAYSNITGLLREGSKGLSDRHAIACILFELLTGKKARSQKIAGQYQSPWPAGQLDIPKDARDLLSIALRVLNDPFEDQAHIDKGKEVKVTNALLKEIQSFIAKHEQEYKRSFLGSMKKGASRVWTRMGLNRKKLEEN